MPSTAALNSAIPAPIRKKDKAAPPPPAPVDYEKMLQHCDAVVVSDGAAAPIGFKDGKPVDANGNPVTDKKSLKGAVMTWMWPDQSLVTDDYGPFQRWQFVNNAAGDALGYIGLTATAAGLAAGLNIPFLAFLGAGTAALVAKSGLNFVGEFLGNNKGRAIDDDPARWTARSGIVNSAALAIQSLCLAVPGAYFALVPTTNALQEFGTQTDTISQQLISNHQAKTGQVGYVTGKNNNQNLISGLIGTGLGFGVSVGLGLAVGPWGPLLAVPAFLGLAVLANQRKSHALKFDNLTNSIVRGLAHQEVTHGAVPTPAELKSNKQARKDLSQQHRILLGANAKPLAQDKARLEQLTPIFGDNNFLLDLGETRGLLGLGKKPTINVVLKTGATTDDQVKGEYTAQVLSDLLESPGFKKMAGCGDEKAEQAAVLQAMRLAVGFTTHFNDMEQALPQQGWSLDRTVLGSGADRLYWEAGHTPIAPISREQLQAFMQNGQVPADEQPAA